MIIETENGKFYDLEWRMVDSLQQAKTAKEANSIFNTYWDSPRVPYHRRLEVWQAVDNYPTHV